MTGKARAAKAAEGDEPVFAYIASLPQPQRRNRPPQTHLSGERSEDEALPAPDRINAFLDKNILSMEFYKCSNLCGHAPLGESG